MQCNSKPGVMWGGHGPSCSVKWERKTSIFMKTLRTYSTNTKELHFNSVHKPGHSLQHDHHHTTTVYGPFSGITRVSRCQKRTSGLYGARVDQQRQTHRPSGWAPLHPDQTKQCPSPSFPHFLQAGWPSCRPTNSVKALKATWPLAKMLARLHWQQQKRQMKLVTFPLKWNTILNSSSIRTLKNCFYIWKQLPSDSWWTTFELPSTEAEYRLAQCIYLKTLPKWLLFLSITLTE